MVSCWRPHGGPVPNSWSLSDRRVVSVFESISPKSLPLSAFECKLSGESGVVEEGLIEHILSVVPPKDRFCIEFGAYNAHTQRLIDIHGFSALLLEGDSKMVDALRKRFSDSGAVRVQYAFITRDNIESLFSENHVPEEPYFLLIDIDGNDYHVWKAIEHYRPTVVCIEFNASFGPDSDFVIDYQEDFVWRHDDYFGASIKPMVELGRAKGYELIHCTSGGDNLFFIRREFYPAFGIPANDIHAMYQLPQYGRYGRAANGKGHPMSTRTSTAWQRAMARARYHAMALPRKIVKHRMKRERRRNLDLLVSRTPSK